MKTTINRQALKDILSVACGIVPSRTPKPILQCVKIDAVDNKLIVTANNLDQQITSTTLSCETIENGVTVIPAKKLLSIISSSNDDTVKINTDDAEAVIKFTDSSFNLYTHVPDKFPDINLVATADYTTSFETNLDDLKTAIHKTQFSIAAEASKYSFNGVLFEGSNDGFVMVGTDGRRMSAANVTGESVPVFRTIVPNVATSMVLKMDGDNVRIGINDSHIKFSCGDSVITSSVISGVFPKWQDILQENENKFTINSQDLKSMVKRASLLSANDEAVFFNIGQSKLCATSRVAETGDAEIVYDIDFDKPVVEIGLSPSMLLSFMGVVENEDISFEFMDAENPVMIIAKGVQYLIMPVEK